MTAIMCDEKQSSTFSRAMDHNCVCNINNNVPQTSSFIESMDAQRQYGNEQWMLLQSKYEISKEIGRGSFGSVRLCQLRKEWRRNRSNFSQSAPNLMDTDNNSTNDDNNPFIAIKIVEKSKLNSRQFKDMQKEISILTQLSTGRHNNIVYCYETFETNRHFYIITELLSEDTLESRIIRMYGKNFSSTNFNSNSSNNNNGNNSVINNNRFDETIVAILFCQILLALDYLHFANIVHRDLKPSNLLFNEKDGMTIKLIDFGLSGVLSKRNNYKLSRRCGTPFYVAPEVIDGKTKTPLYDSKVDMWSAGVILYLMFCGHLPFKLNDDEPLTVLYKQILSADITMESQHWRFVSPAGRDLVLRLLMRDPSRRLSAKQALEHPWIKSMFSNITTNKR